MKVAIFSTHPIQYQIPWFRELTCRKDLDVRVYYGCIPDARQQGTGFDVAFNWDIPMLEGYDWELLERPGEGGGLTGFFSSRVTGIRKVLQRNRPDVAILTGWQGAVLLQALFWCVILGIPRIVRGESNGMKPRSRTVRCIHRLLLPWYSGYLVIGRANHRFYRHYGVSINKMFPCPYFVENRRLLRQAAEDRKRRAGLRASWQIPSGSVCFLYLGKLIEKKRIMDQLAALQLALPREGNLHLLVVGTGELMAAARRQAEENSLPVSFAGFLNQTEITRAYVAADCLVLSSDYDETWGLVVNEAMVCGLPAIVSDRAGCGPDLIEEGVTGALYPFGNVRALAGRMLDMAREPERMREMGKKAQAKVLEDYTVQKSVDGTVDAVEAVAR